MLRSLLSPNDSLQTNKKEYCNSNNKTKRQQYRSREKRERDGQRAKEMEKKWRATAHRPNRKSETKQTCTYSAQQENGSHARARVRAHTKKCCSFTLLYSIPIVMHFFLSYVFAVANSRILEYFKFWFYFCLSFVNFLSRSRNDYSLMTLWVYSFVGFCFFHSIRSRNCTLAGQQRETKKKTKHTHTNTF